MKTALNPPGRKRRLKDKYFPLVILALVFFSSATAQLTRYDSTRIPQINNAYGYEWGTGIYKGMFKPPSDTIKLAQKDSGAIVTLKGVLYIWRGRFWLPVTGAGSNGKYAVNDLSYTSNPNIAVICDSCPATKSNVLAAVDAVATSIYKDATLKGSNTFADPIGVDTTLIATKTDVANATGTGLTAVSHDITLLNTGTGASPLKVDTTVISTRGALYKAIDSLALATGGTAPDGTETKVTVITPGLSISGDGSAANPYKLTNTGSPGSNPFNAFLVTGLVSDVVIPATGSTVTGTNNTPILQAAINSAGDNQLIIVPDGNYLFSTPLDTIQGSKTVHLLILGNTYHNGSDFIILANAGGPTENHTIEHYGECIGRVNSVSQGQTNHDSGLPNWSTYTGTPFKIYNSNEHYIKFNKISGFKNAFEVIGYDYDGASRGTEENTIEGREIKDCANGAVLTSINGRSYVDKTYIRGWAGGLMTFRGGLAIKIDGYSGTAYNGEVYNGAFRSNEFHMLIQRCDSIADANGDITEPLFDVTVEGSAVLGASGWRMRSVSPNYVRDPVYSGRGVFGIEWVQNGMGINAQGYVPIWNSSAGRRFSNDWKTDGSGNLIFVGSTLTKFQRDNSPSTFSYAPGNDAEKYSAVTASTYTAAAGEIIQFNNAAGTLTLPSAASAIGGRITVMNTHATAALTVANAATYTSVPAGDNMTWVSNGTDWRGVVNAEGAGGSGTSQWTDDANGITYGSNIGVRTASKSGAAIAAPAGTTTIAPLNIAPGTRKTTPANGDEQNDGSYRLVTLNGITYKYMLVPDNGGLAGQIIRVNAAATGYEFAYPNYTLAYSQTSYVTIVDTNETSVISGGSKTVSPGNLAVGDKIIAKGVGSILTTGSIQFKFTCGTKTVIIVPANTVTIPVTAGEDDNDKDWDYTMEYTVTSTGTSGAGFLNIKLQMEGEAPVTFDEVVSTGLNSVSPVINVTYKNKGVANVCRSLTNTIEVIRK